MNSYLNASSSRNEAFWDLEIRHETSSTLLSLFHTVKSDELVDIPGPSIGGLSMTRSLEAHSKF